MANTYDDTALTEALHWVRMRIGDTKGDRFQLQDTEIIALLTKRGLTALSVPNDNMIKIIQACIDACMTKAARLGDQSEIVMSDIGPIKSSAADFYLNLAQELRAEIQVANAGPKFANPASFDTTHVVGIDPDPDEE